MEIIIALERMYGLMGYGMSHQNSDNVPVIQNPKLRDAVLFMEGHYSKSLTLKEISATAGMNHTTLTALMKEELGCTAMEYLMRYRVAVAKKQLAFTDVPIKDIAGLVGFKTVPHFSRIFKEHAGTEGRLHSAITAKMLEAKLNNEFSLKVDKKNFKNYTPIKAIGKATVDVILYKDIVGRINIEVVEK